MAADREFKRQHQRRKESDSANDAFMWKSWSKIWKQMLWEKPWETGLRWRTLQRISLHLLRRREAGISRQYARHIKRIKRLLWGNPSKSRAVNAGRSGKEIPSRVPDGGRLTAIPSPSRPMRVQIFYSNLYIAGIWSDKKTESMLIIASV